MSVQITARIVCDDCGTTVSGKIETRSTYAKSAYWSAIDEARRKNWMPLAHGRYGSKKHYCQICAEKHTANQQAGKLKSTAMDFSNSLWEGHRNLVRLKPTRRVLNDEARQAI
jgi:hypothetical protein